MVGVSISIESTSEMSSDHGRENSRINIKELSRAKARIQDDRLVGLVVSKNRWPWPFRKFTVTALYRWPKVSLNREQNRQAKIETEERLAAASGKVEVARLNKFLNVALHGDVALSDLDEVRALRDKAAIVADVQRDADALQARIDAGENVSVPEMLSVLNKVVAAKAIDPKEDAKWARWWRRPKNQKVLDDQRQYIIDSDNRVRAEQWEAARPSGVSQREWFKGEPFDPGGNSRPVSGADSSAHTTDTAPEANTAPEISDLQSRILASYRK